jgi:type IV pilus assembly protein PilM
VVIVVNRKQRVSLSIKDRVIRYVLSSHSSKGPTYHSYGERYLPAGIIEDGKIIKRETFTLILEECISDWKLQGKSTLFTVPDTAVVVRKIDVDAEVPDDEVKGHLYLQLGETLHLPFDEPTFDISVVDQRAGKKEIILIATPENIVQPYQEIFSEVKLKPIVADLSSLAVYRLLYHLDLTNPSEHSLCFQLSVDSMNVTIFHHHIPIFTRHVKLQDEGGSWELHRDVEIQNGLYWYWSGDNSAVEDQLQEAIAELERIMSFYHFSLTKGKDKITKLFITGDHPELPLFLTKCKVSFTIGIEAIQDREIILKDGQAIPSRFNEIIGLSLK